jgi:signal peptidase I
MRYTTYRESASPARWVRRLFRLTLMTFIVYQLVTALLIQSVIHKSVAMEPTLAIGERFFAFPLGYGPRVRLFGWVLPGFRQPRHGDLAVVRPAYVTEPGFVGRLADPFVRFFTLEHRRVDDGEGWDSSLQIKRVVGLPGDTIRIERFIAYVRPAGHREFINEFELSGRDYELTTDERPGAWEPLDPFGAAFETITLGDDEYFVLSDQRTSGIDSRHWGTIGRADLVSHVSLRFWPLRRFGPP